VASPTVKVRPRTAIHYPLGELTPAGVELEVPREIAESWMARGLAEIVSPVVAEVQMPSLQVGASGPKGKRSER